MCADTNGVNANTSEAQKRKKRRSPAVSYASRMKMSESQKRNWQDPGHREKVTRAIREGVANKKKPQHATAASTPAPPPHTEDI